MPKKAYTQQRDAYCQLREIWRELIIILTNLRTATVASEPLGKQSTS
jgi:hypothetical protein